MRTDQIIFFLILEWLLQKLATHIFQQFDDLSFGSDEGKSASSGHGHTEIVRLLLAANKPVTHSALDYASKCGHIEVVKLLLEAHKPCTSYALDWTSRKGHIRGHQTPIDGK